MLQNSSARWRFPSAHISVFRMRGRLRGFLDFTALSDDEIEDLLLAASEAAANAVEHAQQPTVPFFDVSTEFDAGAVTIVILDHGLWLQPTPSPSYRGRGLAMMRALADTTVTATSNGTMVTIRSRGTSPGTPGKAGQAATAGADVALRLPPASPTSAMPGPPRER